MDRMGNGEVKIITGPRRSGKSWLLNRIFKDYLLEQGVAEDNIIIVSFDMDDDEETGDRNFRVTYDEDNNTYAYQYSFANIQGNHEIRFAFEQDTTPHGGFDPVAAGVYMNLQPNPATSQVNLNIVGVTGMVNCMLIDMSGRVVYNQDINAETTQTINLNSLAKGAYFVRITNDKFSKVEKLIVR